MLGNSYGLLIIFEIIFDHFRLFQVAKKHYFSVYIKRFCFVSTTYLVLDIFLFLYFYPHFLHFII